jgi:hypothetical protein
MKKKVDYNKEIPFIRRRCPHLKGDELLEAEERFRTYVKICLGIYARLEAEERRNELKRRKSSISPKGLS